MSRLRGVERHLDASIRWYPYYHGFLYRQYAAHRRRGCWGAVGMERSRLRREESRAIQMNYWDWILVALLVLYLFDLSLCIDRGVGLRDHRKFLDTSGGQTDLRGPHVTWTHLWHGLINEEGNGHFVETTLLHNDHIAITLMFLLLGFPPAHGLRACIGWLCVPCQEVTWVDQVGTSP